jgi:hypothetical protein
MWAISTLWGNVELYYHITNEYNYIVAVREGGLHTSVCFFGEKVPALLYIKRDGWFDIKQGANYD